MGTGTFGNFGYSGGLNSENDLVQFIAQSEGWTVTDVTDYTVDFGADDLLTVGENTTVAFTVEYLDGGAPMSADFTLNVEYLGYDAEGSPHFEVVSNTVAETGSGDPITLGGLTNLIINSIGDSRATDDPGFPRSGAGDFPGFVNEDLALCFAAGTMIATPDGERAVETLRIGDMVTTADGRTVAVKWLGRQTVHKRFTTPERFVPVRVTAGALGDGLPRADLVLTADHALILDNLAINACALVNGTTIRYDPRDSLPDRVTYYHVETEDHDVILANGAPAETYIDYVGRAAFDNHDEYLALYKEERTIAEMAMPRISAARMVPASIRARLGARTAA